MDFSLTDEQRAIQEMATRFASDELAPHAAEWDREKHFPVDVIRKTGELGLAGIYADEAIGGSGLSRLDAVIVFEALSQGDTTTAAYISIHNMVTWMVGAFGSDDVKARYGEALTSARMLGSYCLTEPGSGSDAAALRTRAVRDGDDYVLDGSKAFISGAGSTDLYLVMARTGGDGPRGVSAFLVEDGTPGLSFGANERKMGWNAQPTRVVTFEDCRVPTGNRLGAEGEGFRFAMMGLDGGRLNIAACSLGTAEAAIRQALDYTNERHAFGRRLNENQAMQFKLADMRIEQEAARSLLYRAAWALDEKREEAGQLCAMAKKFVTETGSKVVNDCLQLHGGYGYLADYGIEKLVRDLRVHEILEGTNEIMRVITARHMLAAR